MGLMYIFMETSQNNLLADKPLGVLGVSSTRILLRILKESSANFP